MIFSKQGFTLIELSIVLVIIGLLVGGILAAQSMISSAKLNSGVQQIGQIDASVVSFKEKYNYLPGDAPGFGGDGNGLIDSGSIDRFGCEMANFWYSINPEEYSSSTCVAPGATFTRSGAGKNVLPSKFGQNGAYFVASVIGAPGLCGGQIDPVNPKNNYTILTVPPIFDISWNRLTTTTDTNSALTPAELFALDKKIDNGIANDGYISSGAVCNEAGTGHGHIRIVPLATCSVGANYVLSNTSYTCTPIIRMGSTAGSPF